MLILGIDTSCDDTAASVINGEFEIISSMVSSQDEVHSKFGGVVPELASRRHVENIIPIIDSTMRQAGASFEPGQNRLNMIAVTRGPGLVGSLIVGISAAKAISVAMGIPLLGVNHLEGHIASSFLTDTPPEYPFVALVVSGGHTNLYIVKGRCEYDLVGQTLDDAAGEAFDKVAKLLGLGYPGGRKIEEITRAHRAGDGEPIRFPRAYMGKDSSDFSFSGVKTAVRNFVSSEGEIDESMKRRVAFGFQEAVIWVLVDKTIGLAIREGIKTIVVTGGVAANDSLRRLFKEKAIEKDIRLIIPPKELCTDNAAMIGAVGVLRHHEACLNNLEMNAVSRWKI